MKIRNGFVSNSSSSSFIVDYITFKSKKQKLLLNKKQIKLLEKCGFLKTRVANPSYIDNYDNFKKFQLIENENYYFDVSLSYYVECNEHYIFSLLIKNNIPFRASVHYNHSVYIYEKDSKFIYILNNFGERYGYGCGSFKEFLKEIKTSEPFYKVNIDQYFNDDYKEYFKNLG